MKNALGWKTGAAILAIACFIFGPWTCSVQSESVTSSLKEAFSIDPRISIALLGITCFITIFGGLKRISSVMEKVVPLMAMIYIIAGFGILILFINKVPAAFMLIFKSAFTPMAGVGGFAGATVRDAIRYGVARGLYSNDAGTGYGMIAHASAKTDHPVRQASWGWGEVFLDTIVVCSVTALSLILTNVYVTHPGVTSARLTTVAFGEVYGVFGKCFMALAITVFAWTTIIGMYYSCEKSVNYVFGDTKRNKIVTKIYMLYYLVPCVFLYNVQATTLWAMTDILSGIYVIVTMVFIYTKQKEIIRLFKDFWDRYLPLKEQGKDVPPVVYGQKEEV
jgi:AGCS family alanine or glycine:cation symporter